MQSCRMWVERSESLHASTSLRNPSMAHTSWLHSLILKCFAVVDCKSNFEVLLSLRSPNKLFHPNIALHMGVSNIK